MHEIDWEKVFTYQPATEDTIPKYNAIREQAKVFVQTILDNAPGCADRSAAIRKVREAVMTANAAIALDGEV